MWKTSLITFVSAASVVLLASCESTVETEKVSGAKKPSEKRDGAAPVPNETPAKIVINLPDKPSPSPSPPSDDNPVVVPTTYIMPNVSINGSGRTKSIRLSAVIDPPTLGANQAADQLDAYICLSKQAADLDVLPTDSLPSDSHAALCPSHLSGVDPLSEIKIDGLDTESTYHLVAYVKGRQTGDVHRLEKKQISTVITLENPVAVKDDLSNAADPYLFNGPIIGGYVWGSCTDTVANKRYLCRKEIATEVIQLIESANGEFCTNLSSYYMSAFAGKLIYSCQSDVSGNQLWISDGTKAGTVALTNITNAQFSIPAPNIAAQQVLNGQFYFSVSFGGLRELWRTDGTPAGTGLLFDTNPNPGLHSGNDFASSPAVLGSYVYFGAMGSNGEVELWRSDGSTTALFKDLWPGVAWGSPNSFYVLDGKLYFTAFYGMSARIFSSDGTVGGTNPIYDITGGALNTTWFGASSTHLYLRNGTATMGEEVFVVNRSTGVASLLGDLTPGSLGSNIYRMEFIGSKAYFIYSSGVFSDLYESDGTFAGTRMVKRINPTQNSSASIIGADAGTIFFMANDGVHGVELWKSDGTEAGTVMVGDFNPGAGHSYPSWAYRDGSNYYFYMNHPRLSTELIKYDSVAQTLTMVSDRGTAPYNVFPNVLDNKLYFSMGSGIIDKIYGVADLADAGDNPLAAETSFIQPQQGLYGTSFYRLGSKYGYVDSALGQILSTDFTAEGTVDSGLSYVANTYMHNFVTSPLGTFYQFFATSPSFQQRVVLYDQENNQGIDLGSLPLSSWSRFRVVGGTSSHMYYAAATSFANYRLYATDGTNPISLVTEPCGGAMSSAVGMTVSTAVSGFIGNRLIFAGGDCTGFELWESDGTAVGTKLLKDLNPTGFSAPENFHSAGDYVVFVATDGVNGKQFWSTDGTSDGTVMHLIPDTTDVSATLLKKHGDRLYFSAKNASSGREIWCFDGTSRSFQKVSEFGAGAMDMRVGTTATFGDYFVVTEITSSNQSQLWALHKDQTTWQLLRTFDAPIEVYPSTNDTIWVGYGKADNLGAALLGLQMIE